jgi:glycosyltransferase involved in cell wall biosynthesis
MLREAFFLLRETEPDVSLVIGGSFTDEPEGEGIEYLGVVSDLRAFFKQVDLVVIPSEYDSFPNVFLEALAAERLVLMTDTPITREICAGARSILFPRSAVCLAERLSILRRRRGGLQDLMRECIELRRRYSFDWVSEMERAMLEESLRDDQNIAE